MPSASNLALNGMFSLYEFIRMSKKEIIALLVSLAATPVCAQGVPFATPPPSNVISLGDIMGTIQIRHIKLWKAIEHRNWPLVEYELGQTRDSFLRAALLYLKIPTEFVIAVDQPLELIRKAANSKDLFKSKQAYAELTAACNACHQAAGVGFIRIQTPTASPFSDQAFEPLVTRK